MMHVIVVLLSLIALIIPHVTAQQAYAHAVLHRFYNSSEANTAIPIQGTVDFLQNDDGTGNVTITVKILGLQSNKNYSLHIHQWGNFDGYVNLTSGVVPSTEMSLSAVGGHFNPFGQNHSCGYGTPRHAGDVGNVFIPNGTDPSTYVTIVLYSELLDLGRDMINNNSIIGRTVAIHEKQDPCVPDVPLGGWVAIGVIGINNMPNNNATTEVITPDGMQAPQATALIFNTTSGLPSGEINFWTDANNQVHMQGFLSGFTPFSEHGIHIHEYGNEDNMNTIGPHFGPTTTQHALPPKATRHWGDLGNVVADGNGNIIFSDDWAGLNLISIQTPLNSILGRAIAIHEFGDNGTAPIGDFIGYGPRYNFGVIGLAAPDFVRPALPAPYYPTVARAQVIFRAFYYNPNATFSATSLVGNATFTQNVDGGIVNITVMLAGLRGNASYGLHIHQWGNEIHSFDWNTGSPFTTKSSLPNATVDGVGGHLNPFNQPHSCYPNPARHEGDIGNITVGSIPDDQQSTYMTYLLQSELLDLGRNMINNDSIIGRTVTLHDLPNPCDNSALGNWIAIGVIGIDTTNIAAGEQNVASQDDGLPSSNDNNSPKANAVIRDIRNNQIVGDLFFFRGYSNEIRVMGAVAGFAPNSSHGVHIHQFGNENSNITIGTHWAAPGQDGNDFHALAPYAGRHYGDVFGNVTADANGVITFANVSTGFDLLSLTNASNSIIGHSIAIHEKADDGTAASYGPRYRFGVIGLVHPDFPIPNFVAPNVIPPTTAAPTTVSPTTASPTTTSPTTASPSSGGAGNGTTSGTGSGTGTGTGNNGTVITGTGTGSTNGTIITSTGSAGSNNGTGSGTNNGTNSGTGTGTGTGNNNNTTPAPTQQPGGANAAYIISASLAFVVTLLATLI